MEESEKKEEVKQLQVESILHNGTKSDNNESSQKVSQQESEYFSSTLPDEFYVALIKYVDLDVIFGKLIRLNKHMMTLV
jgi:hypothetical protein